MNKKEEKFSTHSIVHDEYYNRVMDWDMPWFDPKTARIDELCGWSLDFQTYYIMLSLLDRNRPKNILELGFGFSSLPINQYARNFGARHDICEGNTEWIDYFNQKYCKDGGWNFNLIVKNEIVKTIYGYENCRIYDDFRNGLNPPYDFVLIDGPAGSKETVSRANILNDIDVLDKHSTVIFHDTRRVGEQITMSKMMENLKGYWKRDFNLCSVITNIDVSLDGMEASK